MIRVSALPTLGSAQPRAALDVALSDLPLGLLKLLDLGRPMLNHRDERPACAAATTVESRPFDRANHRVGGGRPATVPEAAFTAAREFCAGCPIRVECGAEADAKREEGLWGGAYRLRLSSSGRRQTYRVMELLPAPEPIAS